MRRSGSCSALALLSIFYATSPLAADHLTFNGSVLDRLSNTAAKVIYRTQRDPDYIETVEVQSLASEPNFDVAVRALVSRSKTSSRGAKLKMLEKANAREIIIIYLTSITTEKVIFKAERLSGAGSSLATVSYSAEFEPGNITDEQEAKVKTTAVDALSKFDMDRVQTLLK